MHLSKFDDGGLVDAEKLLKIIYESCDLLLVNKQAGLVCHPTKGDLYSSLIGRLRLYLGFEANVHMINRLDRETSGLVVVAKHRRAAVGLRKLWEAHKVLKQYLAIAHGWPEEEHVVISVPLARDQASILSIKDCVRPDGAAAHTEFFVKKRFRRSGKEFSLLKVVPTTGRKHQIRIHLAHCGHPIVGDKLYGGDENLYLSFVQRRLTSEQRARLILPCHALHAQEVRISWRERKLTFEAEPEEWFTEFHRVS
ncbi:MAG: RluA family pseudouridine synthase [Verrucomicrobiales bacterium]|nr:RluA family pseudouridine synthase [Verrucomicrobiales bacterium]